MNVDLKFQEEMKKKQRPLKSPKVNVQCIQFMCAFIIHFDQPLQRSMYSDRSGVLVSVSGKQLLK